jgi:hypothetical protein
MNSGKRSKKDIEEELDNSIRIAKKSFEKLTELSVAKKMDFNYDEYYKITQKDRKFSNKQLESFMQRFCKADDYGKRYLGKKDKNGFFPVYSSDENDNFKEQGTFDSEIALANSKLEFLAFGHSIVNNCITYSHSDSFDGLTGIKVIEYEQSLCGLLCYYLVTYNSISETKELIPVVIDLDQNLLNYELDDIEREVVHSVGNHKVSFEKRASEINVTIDRLDDLMAKARERILEKVEHKVWDIKENLDLHIDPEIEKITESYNKQLYELRDKLSRQESRMQLLGKDMRSAITRTRNQIAKTKREMELVLAKYRKYHGVTYSIKLNSAGIIINQDL